jgi:hypothetical protein
MYSSTVSNKQQRLLRALATSNSVALKLFYAKLVESVDVCLLERIAIETLPKFCVNDKQLRPKEDRRVPIRYDNLSSAPGQLHVYDQYEAVPDDMDVCTDSEHEHEHKATVGVIDTKDTIDAIEMKDKIDLKRGYGKESLTKKMEMAVNKLLPISRGLISGTDPSPIQHDDWDTLGELYRQMHSSFEIVKVGWSASDLMDQLPRVLEAIRVGTGARVVNETERLRTTLYMTTLHFEGEFGASYSRPGGPMERIWGLTTCSGVAKWLKKPKNDKDVNKILAQIRSYKDKVDTIPNTELLFIVLETYSWGTLKPHLEGFLARVAALCRSIGISVVADETFTGLGIMGDGNYFGFQHEDYGFVPDVVLTGKQSVLSLLLLNLHKDNPLVDNYIKLAMQMVIQNATTVFADVFSIQRTTTVLKAILANKKYLKTGMKLTQELPGLLKRHGLSVPTGGGGFVWKFAKCNLSPALELNTDGFGRMRLPLDSTFDSVCDTLNLLRGDM